MSSLFTAFCKSITCPSSQALLAYRRLDLCRTDASQIKAHLGTCDFCNAELQLLRRHSDNWEEHPVAEMPKQLRRLAESLLSRSVLPLKPFADCSQNN